MPFCALSTDQHKSLYKLIFKNIMDKQNFDLTSFSQELYNKVYAASKNHELALTYASFVPSYAANLQTEDKEVRTIFKAAKVDANELIDKIDEWENNIETVQGDLKIAKPVEAVTPAPAAKVPHVVPLVENAVEQLAALNEKLSKSNTAYASVKEFENSFNGFINWVQKTQKGKKFTGSVIGYLSALQENNPAEVTKLLQQFTESPEFKSSNTSIIKDIMKPEPAETEGTPTPATNVKEAQDLLYDNLQRAKEKTGIEKIMKSVFGLGDAESSAVAAIYDRVAQAFATRYKTTRDAFFEKLAFRKSDIMDLKPGVQFQNAQAAEKADIKSKAIKDGNFLKAPNGENTKLPEDQWLSVRTANFKNWFGDWEKSPNNASKVVDENGEPLVMYHGSKSSDKFTEFDAEKIKGHGFYFISDKKYADDFSEQFKSDNVLGVFLNIRNPETDMKVLGWTPSIMKKDKEGRTTNMNEVMPLIRQHYKDIFKNNDGTLMTFQDKTKLVIVSPEGSNNIKSATDNNGNFNKDSSNILYQIIGEKGSINLDNKSINNLFIAKNMEANGRDNDFIFHATGWERTAEGKWAMEINDHPINIEALKKGVTAGRGTFNLRSIYKNDNLYKAYPELAARTVTLDPDLAVGAGSFNIESKNLTLSGKSIVDTLNNTKLSETQKAAELEKVQQELTETLIHEIQHWIQTKEGFARGSSVEEGASIMEDMMEKGIEVKDSAHGTYRKVAGEVQAFNTQNRLNLTEDQRMQVPISATEDVARGQQIILHQQPGAIAHAAVQIAEDGSAIIHALTDPNVSSPLHELAHVWEKQLTDKERQTVLEWTGQEDKWTIDTSEAFARGFESFLADPNTYTSNATLQELFVSFRKWLKDIYKSVFNSPLDLQLNEPMRDLYRSMLGDNYRQATLDEVTGEQRVLSDAQKMAADYNKEATMSRDFTTPIPPGSTNYWSHLSTIQQAFINKQYDQLIQEGKMDEERLREIVSSTKSLENEGLGMDLVDQTMFRNSRQDLIEDKDYWVTFPSSDSQEFPSYVRTVREIIGNGSLLQSIQNDIISPELASRILKHSGQIGIKEERAIKLKIEENEKQAKEVKKVDKKAAQEVKAAEPTVVKPELAPIIAEEKQSFPQDDEELLPANEEPLVESQAVPVRRTASGKAIKAAPVYSATPAGEEAPKLRATDMSTENTDDMVAEARRESIRKDARELNEKKRTNKDNPVGDVYAYALANTKTPEEFDDAMEAIAQQANDPLSRRGIVSSLGEKIVKRAQEMFPDAAVAPQLTKEQIDALPDVEEFDTPIAQGDTVSYDGDEYTVESIMYGATPEETTYILDNGMAKSADEIRRVRSSDEQNVEDFNKIIPPVFNSIEQEFGHDTRPVVQTITVQKITSEIDKSPVTKRDLPKVLSYIDKVLDKAKHDKKSVNEVINILKDGTYKVTFVAKELEVVRDYVNDYLNGSTGVQFSDFVENVNYKDRTVKQVKEKAEEKEMFNYIGLKTVLDRLKTKFQGAIDYKIVSTDEDFVGRFNNGVVEINLKRFDKTTPFHEYLHPFVAVLNKDNPELYDALIEELKSTKEGFDYIDEVKAIPFYSKKTTNEQEEEALVRYLAKKSSENVDSQGRRKEDKYLSAASRLVKKFADWFDKLWSKITGRQLVKYTNKDKEARSLPVTASLQDVADIFSLHDLQFDISNRMELVKSIEKYQVEEAAADEGSFEDKILKRIRTKLKVLEDTARNRIGSDELLKEVIGVRTVLKEAGDNKVMALASYMQEGFQSMHAASTKFGQITNKLKAGEGNLSEEDLKEFSKELEVIKNLVSFYTEATDYYNYTKRELGAKDANYFNEAIAGAENAITKMQNRSAEITTEWLFPYVQRMNDKLLQKYTQKELEDKGLFMTKEKFKSSLYSANGDIDQAFFLLGSVGSSKDVFSAVMRSALYSIVEETHFYESDLLESTKSEYGRFLQKTGLENGRKATTDYYKQHYMRKASIRYVEKYDEDHNPVYAYKDHWAFHEKYFYDKFDKDRTAFMEDVTNFGGVPFDGTLQPHLDKLSEWEKANGHVEQIGTRKDWKNTYAPEDENNPLAKPIGQVEVDVPVTKLIPNDKYLNPEFAALQSDPFYSHIYNTYKEANEKLGDGQLLYGIVPQVSKGKNAFVEFKNKSTTEKLKLLGQKVGKSVLSTAFPTVKEEENSPVLENLDGSKNYAIKGFHNYLLEEDDLDLSLPETIVKFAGSAKLNELKSEMNPLVKTAKSLIEDNPKIKQQARKVIQTTTKGRTMFDKIMNRPASVENARSRLNEQLVEFINDAMYGESQIESNVNVFGHAVNLNKLGRNWSFLTALNNMAFNINGTVNNLLIGHAMLFIDATGGRFFKKADLLKAHGQYMSNFGDFLKDGFRLEKSIVTQMGIKYDAVQGEFRDKFGKRFVGNIADRYANGDTLFIFNHAAEHEIQLTGMLSMMNATKVKLKDGSGEISLFDAHYLDDKGNLRMRDDIEWDNQKNLDFINMTHGVNKRLNGNYSGFDKTVMQRRWYGQLALVYRKFIYTSIRTRFAKEYVDYELGGIDYGYQRKFFSKLASDIKEYKFDAAQRFWSKEGWDEDQKISATKTLTEFGILAGTFVLALVIGMGDNDGKDEDKWALNLAHLYTARFRDDLKLFTLLGIPDIYKILKNPSAILGTMDKYVAFFQQLVTDPMGAYEQKQGSFDKGELKLKAKMLKALPVARQVINFLNPKDQLTYLQLLK